MATFVLIHGAYHGGWCWDLLRPELERRGHGAIAPTLPITDPTKGNDEYATVVLGAMEGLADDEEVIIVGHSMGGTCLPHVTARRSCSKLVYLAAAVPAPGAAFGDFVAEHPGFVKMDLSGGMDNAGCMIPDQRLVTAAFFHDCTPGLAKWAAGCLRPQAPAPIVNVCELDSFADTPTEYVVCLDDRILDPEICRYLAQSRLGVKAIELPGSHSPFLSRPEALADLLVEMT